jgi:hypothetical protein
MTGLDLVYFFALVLVRSTPLCLLSGHLPMLLERPARGRD